MDAELPFVWRPAGGRDATDAVAVAAAQAWGLPGPELVAMGMNGVYRAGDAVIRVGAVNGRLRAAADLARVLADAGVRVPAPLEAEPYATDGLLAATAWEHVPDMGGAIDWRTVGEMVAIVHRLDLEQVPVGYPLPWCGDFPWWQLGELLDESADEVEALDTQAVDELRAVVEDAGDWAAGVPASVVCHGDVHWDNVVMSVDGPVLLDWDLLCLGPPAWDHAPMLRAERWGRPPGEYQRFASGLGDDLRGDRLAESLAELRLVAATLLRVRAGRRDPVAREEARRRLRYWCGDADAPVWTAWR